MKILKCLGYLSYSRRQGRIKILMCLSYNCIRAVLKVYLECLSALFFFFLIFYLKRAGHTWEYFPKLLGMNMYQTWVFD